MWLFIPKEPCSRQLYDQQNELDTELYIEKNTKSDGISNLKPRSIGILFQSFLNDASIHSVARLFNNLALFN